MADSKKRVTPENSFARVGGQLVREFGQLWFPSACHGCGANGQSPCAHCCDSFAEPPDEPIPVGLHDLLVVVAYDENFRRFWMAVKNQGNRKVLRWFGEQLVEVVQHAVLQVDVVTWAPTSSVRRRQRGFDQSQLLARQLAAVYGKRAIATLRRHRGAPQTGRNRQERLGGVAFSARRRIEGRVLLCDDVVTTGATMAAAARTLLDAGAEIVIGAAVARTAAVNSLLN